MARSGKHKSRKPRDINDYSRNTIALIRNYPATNELYIAVSLTTESPSTCRKLARWLEDAADWLDDQEKK
jgi:hypothetical protein